MRTELHTDFRSVEKQRDAVEAARVGTVQGPMELHGKLAVATIDSVQVEASVVVERRAGIDLVTTFEQRRHRCIDVACANDDVQIAEGSWTLVRMAAQVKVHALVDQGSDAHGLEELAERLQLNTRLRSAFHQFDTDGMPPVHDLAIDLGVALQNRGYPARHSIAASAVERLLPGEAVAGERPSDVLDLPAGRRSGGQQQAILSREDVGGESFLNTLAQLRLHAFPGDPFLHSKSSCPTVQRTVNKSAGTAALPARQASPVELTREDRNGRSGWTTRAR